MRMRQSLISALIAGLLISTGLAVSESSTLNLKIQEVMTADEMRDTGVSHMTPQQREALNTWLNRYTISVMSVANRKASASVAASTPGSCSPTVESSIAGDFSGWNGETIFKLNNGQIWQQAEYDYMYSYLYHPDVTIYATSSGCRMKVEDEDETIVVRRIK